MSPFWSSMAERLKDYGRDGTLFIVALAGFVVVAAVSSSEFVKVIAPALPFTAIFILGWAGYAIRRALINRRRRLEHSPLSDDELQKARAKLTRRRWH
jgi:hypothetical protein